MARPKNPPGSVDWRLYRKCLECGVDRRQICRDQHDNKMTKPCPGRRLIVSPLASGAATSER